MFDMAKVIANAQGLENLMQSKQLAPLKQKIAQAQLSGAEMENLKRAIPLIQQRIKGVKDQQSYDAARQDAISNGLIKPEDWPAEYNDQAVQKLKDMYGGTIGIEKILTYESGGKTHNIGVTTGGGNVLLGSQDIGQKAEMEAAAKARGKAKGESAGGGKWGTVDDARLYKGVAALFPGKQIISTDASGNTVIDFQRDQKDARKAAGIAKMARDFMISQDLGFQEAINRAAQRYGIEIPNMPVNPMSGGSGGPAQATQQGGGSNNPTNILNNLNNY